MTKITCPRCGGPARYVYSHYTQGSIFKHNFYRCLKCLFLFDRTQQLKVERVIAKGFPDHYSAMPDT